MDDSGYLHGWLDRHGDGWQAKLIFYDMDEEPWCAHSGVRMNATGEYLLLVLDAVLRLRMALFPCWPRQDVIFRAGVVLVIKRRK